jgi:hypothetical protein
VTRLFCAVEVTRADSFDDVGHDSSLIAGAADGDG